MTIYKENIQEIVDNWNGFPLQEPCDHIDSKGKPIPGVKPAINAGNVQLKCFINNTCPFYESGYKEDNLVFNESTFLRILPWLPDDLRNALTVTPGANGMHFTPRWVLRHNYIYHKKTETGEIDVSPIDGLFDDFDTNYKEVNQFKNGFSSGVSGVDETRYKAEQSWVVLKSIFDPSSDDTGVEECDAQAEWRYRGQPVTDSDITDPDLAYDYNLKYYNDYVNSWDTSKSPPEMIPKPLARIDKSNVQMPVQDRVRDSKNRGVHWRLMKRTPLFKGEDFFIRFYRQAQNSVSKPNDPGAVPFPVEFKDYWALDITRTDPIKMTSVASGPNVLTRKRNFAISPPSKEGEKPDTKSFDFHDQAYYIIELGVGSDTDRYCIIITERSNPIFVNFVPGSAGSTSGSTAWGDLVSKKFGDPAEITGSQLMQSKWFDMTVRNHLGSLVIQFYGPGIDAPPWIIKRLDWIPQTDPITGEPYLQDKSRALFVPRGRMSIMGGNLRSGFMFGPLQYQTRHITMIYPPREQLVEREDMDLAFTFGSPEELTARTMGGAFKSSPFFLPSQGAHDILFSSTDIFLEDLSRHAIPVGEAAINQPLFTHDAQFYRNYYESNDPTDTGDYRYGGFFYDDTLRDFSDTVATASGTATIPRTSNIIVKKYRYLNDPGTRQQAFDILIGMMAGDHQFTNSFWNGGSPPEPATAKDEPLRAIDHTAIPDEVWMVQACKTPIVSSLRLIAYESETTRWNDGTSVGTGINFAPFDPDDNPIPRGGSLTSNSSYFIDASDHVMSFSDSWSASGFSEMEHSGSINFYLNRGMSVDNNVTDELMSLQNKTFYVEIWAGYTEKTNGDCDFDSYSRQNGLFKLFTGLCHGGEISYEYGKTIMSCKIEDYTAVLKGMRFFNSPWFDGVKDINCIREIMQMAGFRDVGKYDSGSLIKLLSDSVANNTSGVFYHHFDGRLFKMENYALPSGYNRLDQPAFKFDDGEPLYDAVVKIAKRAGKVFFFDQFGIAHYENHQDFLRSNYLGGVPLVPLCSFTSNPEVYPGQLIFNKLERFYDVSGIYNHIKIMSNTPDFHLLIADALNWSSMDNPASEGFIGYLKSEYQQESMFGSKAAVLNTMAIYSVGFRPKIKAKFSTYGVPLRANDIVQINGENTRVMKVSNTITAEDNEWWMDVETEKYQIVNASTAVS